MPAQYNGTAETRGRGGGRLADAANHPAAAGLRPLSWEPARMSSQAESRTVYAAGLVQGVVLVTFPAASTIFTAPSQYGLSSTQYGAMFLPQAVVAVGTALAQGGLAQRFGAKRVY